MLTSVEIKKIVTEARPLIERQLELADQIAGLREVVTAAGGDWSQLKALVKAQIQDERDDAGDGKRVRKILDKAEYATAYADMLGLGDLNEKNSFAEDFDPDTGEIIESPSAPRGSTSVAADGPEQGQPPPSLGANNSLPADPHPVVAEGGEPNASHGLAATNSHAVETASHPAVESGVGPLLAGKGGEADRPLISENVIAPAGQPNGDGPTDAAASTPQAGGATPFAVSPHHFKNSAGLLRLNGCQDPECCGSVQPRVKLCFRCSIAHDGPTYQAEAAE